MSEKSDEDGSAPTPKHVFPDPLIQHLMVFGMHAYCETIFPIVTRIAQRQEGGHTLHAKSYSDSILKFLKMKMIWKEFLSRC